MNVIIANKYKDALSNLDIDVIKRLDGEFDVATIVDTFANFYFNRMILDITAIKDSFNIATIQRLSASLDASKIILFLSDDPRINNSYLSKIISLGIYNFTSDLAGVNYLMENPNGYRDVAQYHDLAMNDEKSLKDSKLGVFAPNMQQNNIQGGFGGNQAPYTQYQQPPIQQSYGNMGNPMDQGVMQGQNPAFQGFQPYGGGGYGVGTTPNYNTGLGGNTKVIGFKDLTEDAGATTLIYMLKKNLKGRKVLAVEINNNDFSYFNDSELMSVSAGQVSNLRSKFAQFDIVLVDLNNSSMDMESACTDIIYLLEPSTIKLNTLMRRDRMALEKIKDKKIVLNKSLLSQSDLKEFEYEAKVKMFYNIPPLDERKDSQMVLDSFLEKLGIFSGGNSGGGLFNLFKK